MRLGDVMMITWLHDGEMVLALLAERHTQADTWTLFGALTFPCVQNLHLHEEHFFISYYLVCITQCIFLCGLEMLDVPFDRTASSHVSK